MNYDCLVESVKQTSRIKNVLVGQLRQRIDELKRSEDEVKSLLKVLNRGKKNRFWIDWMMDYIETKKYETQNFSVFSIASMHVSIID